RPRPARDGERPALRARQSVEARDWARDRVRRRLHLREVPRLAAGRCARRSAARLAASRRVAPMSGRARVALRLGFLALLAGGLIVWTQLRKPRDLRLEVDLTSVLPGEITEVDLVVRRGGSLIARSDVVYGQAGAPGLIETVVRAAPGRAEVEATLVYSAGKPARRV